MFSDNPDFFPTQRHIARRMLAKITNKDAKYFLDPNGGKGDLADVIKNPCTFEEFEAEHPDRAQRRADGYRWSAERHDRVHVDVIESYPALIQVLRSKQYDVVGFDCAQCERVRRVGSDAFEAVENKFLQVRDLFALS